MENQGNGNYGKPAFYGMVKPYQPKRKGNPVLDKKLPLGSRGDYFSTIIVRILPPTLEYPKAGIFFGFNNGNSRTFSMVTLEDLESLFQFLTDTIPQVRELLPTLEQAETVIDQQQQELWKSGELQRAMAHMQEIIANQNKSMAISEEEIIEG